MITKLVAAYKLWHEFASNIPKGIRYSLGDKIDRSFVETLEIIYTASYLDRNRKLVYLEKAIGKFDTLKFLLQVLWEIRKINNDKYVILSEQLNEVGRMLGGWKKGLESKTPAR